MVPPQDSNNTIPISDEIDDWDVPNENFPACICIRDFTDVDKIVSDHSMKVNDNHLKSVNTWENLHTLDIIQLMIK